MTVWRRFSKTELARLAVLLVCLPFSFYSDWQHFNFSEKSSYLLYTISKLVQLSSLYLLLGQVLNASRKKWTEGKFRSVLLTFAVLFAGLLLFWSGSWVEVDEHKIHRYALMLKVYPTRGLLVVALYIVGLVFFFHPAMIAGPQLILGAWIYADLIQRCRAMTGKGARPISLLLFSPAVLYCLYQPMHTFLFGILLVMFLQRYLMFWNRQEDDNLQRDVLQLSLLVAGVICIWTGTRFLLIFYSIILTVLFVGKKLAFIGWITTVVLVMGLALIGYMVRERGCAGGDSPAALNYVMPIYTILQGPKFDQEMYCEKLESIDRVYALDEITSKTNRACTLAEPRNGYTRQEMGQFLQSSIRLVLVYPIDFLCCRWNEFVVSVGFDEETGYVWIAENAAGEHVENWDVGDLTRRAKPLNPIPRNKASRFLGGWFIVPGINMNFVFWVFRIPIVITAGLFLVSLWEKRLDFVLVLSVLFIELAGAALTIPVKYAMYYFANYLEGWHSLYLYCVLVGTNQAVCAGSGQRD